MLIKRTKTEKIAACCRLVVVVCGRVDLVLGMLFELFDVDLRPRKIPKSATRMPVNPLLGFAGRAGSL